MVNKIKTFKAKTPEEQDNVVNEFAKLHNVFASQTHVNVIQGNPATTIYTTVVFYKE